VPSNTAGLIVEGDAMSVNLSKVPFRKMLAMLAEKMGIKVFVAHTVPEDEVSDAFEKVPLDAAIKRLLAGKGYALRYAPIPPEAQKGHVGTRQRIAELHVVPKGSGLESVYRMEEVGRPIDAARPRADPLLEQAFHAKTGPERAAALKEYLNQGEPDYAAVTEALKDADPEVRKIALQGMEDADTLPAEATAEVAITDTDPALRMQAMRILVERGAGTAAATLERASRPGFPCPGPCAGDGETGQGDRQL